MILAMFYGGTTTSLATDTSSHQSRYVYCNVYLDSVCFGIASSDTLDMKIPADFVLYTIELGSGAKAVIYSGNNPQDDVFSSSQSKYCEVSDSAGKCVYVKSPNALDLLYQADANASFVHIHLTGVKATNVDDVQDFLANFRSCKPVDQSIQCTNARIFKNVTI
jgi:hypothetical protein